MTFRKAGLLLILTATVALLAAGNGYKLFQQGLAKERAEADLRGAIQIYEQVVSESATDRKLAAQALFRIGECQAALGDPGARKIYERVVGDYAEQKEVVAEAQARLAAMRPSAASSIVTRLVKNVDGIDPRAISPDGSFAAFANWERVTDPASSRTAWGGLAIRDLHTGENRQLTWVQNGYDRYVDEARISPDGRLVAYGEYHDGREDKQLHILPVDGSAAPRTVYRMRGYFEICEWTPDGRYLLASQVLPDETWQLILISTQDGSVQQLRSFQWQRPGQTSISPDGRWVAYGLASQNELDEDIFVISIDASEETELLEHPAADSFPVWSPDGSTIFFMSERTTVPSLWSIPVRDGKAAGEPSVVKSDIGPAGRFKITQSGTLYYRVRSQTSLNIYSVGLDGDGKATGEPRLATELNFGSNYGATLSPDGQRLAFYSRRPKQTLVIRDLESGTETTFPIDTGRLIRRGGYEEGPRWFPDGRSLLVGVMTGQRDLFFRMNAATGAREEVRIPRRTAPMIRPSPDGKSLIYRAGPRQLMRFDLETGQETVLSQFAKEPRSVIYDCALSPDGTQLAYTVENADLGSFLYVMPLAGGVPHVIRQEAVREGGSRFNALSWIPDGRFLLRADRDGRSLLRIAVEGGEPKNAGFKINGGIKSPEVSPDGRSLFFTAIRAGSSGGMWALENFLPEQRASR